MRVLFTALSRWLDLVEPVLDRVEPSFAGDPPPSAGQAADPMFAAAPADRTALALLRAIAARREPELGVKMDAAHAETAAEADDFPITLCDIPL